MYMGVRNLEPSSNHSRETDMWNSARLLILLPALSLALACGDVVTSSEHHDGPGVTAEQGASAAARAADHQSGHVILEQLIGDHPESATTSPDGSAYLVSNLGVGIGDGPVPHLFDIDDNGYISRINVGSDGSLGAVDTDWISSALGVDVDGITGIAVQGTQLYAVDRDEILVFDISDLDAPTPAGSIDLPPGDRVLPNDIAVREDGTIYFSDTGLDRFLNPTDAQSVWRRNPDETWDHLRSFSSDELVCPNGVATGGESEALFVTFCSAVLYRVDEADADNVEELRAFRGPASVDIGRLDGIVRHDGVLFISDWRGLREHAGGIHRVSDPQSSRLVGNLFLPADIGLDADRDRILIPSDGYQSLRVVELRP